MDNSRLKQAEAWFLAKYPGGFQHPEIVAVGKKHKMDSMVEMAQQAFSKKAFRDTEQVCADMVKLVSRSSLVSVFEKPRFRDFVKRLTPNEKQFLADALRKQLHGKQAVGFEAMLDLLSTEKLAKWTLISVIPTYFRPEQEVFVKPTTTKLILKELAIDELQYKPRPSWAFYEGYRERINQLKNQVDTGLSPSNVAFSGFLMMALPQISGSLLPEKAR